MLAPHSGSAEPIFAPRSGPMVGREALGVRASLRLEQTSDAHPGTLLWWTPRRLGSHTRMKLCVESDDSQRIVVMLLHEILVKYLDALVAR